MSLAKDASILAMLDRLDLAGHGWVIVDNWDGDECAVGIARAGQPRRLVYVSTFETGPDRYDYECEEPIGEDQTDYRVVARGTAPSLKELRSVLIRHLDSG
jgi:hypothetical protein